MDSQALSVISGIILFAIGFKVLTWSSNKATGSEIGEALTNQYTNFNDSYEPHSVSYFALVVGFSLLCAGSILVGGVFFGWSGERTFSELYNVCGQILSYLL